MSNVMIVKLSLLVFKKGDDLAIITFEKVMIAKKFLVSGSMNMN